MRTKMRIERLLFQGVFLPLFYAEYAWGLECWQCIGDDCDLHPRENDRAEKKNCRIGESCQKVYYKVKADKQGEDSFYESVTRSCSAGRCDPRNDFINCTYDQLENPGCTQKYCCDDTDFCNTAVTRHLDHTIYFILLVIVLAYLTSAGTTHPFDFKFT